MDGEATPAGDAGGMADLTSAAPREGAAGYAIRPVLLPGHRGRPQFPAR